MHIRCLFLDVDGVLTDGSFYVLDDGRIARRFHVHDGFALKWAQECGLQIVIITAKDDDSLRHRFEPLGLTRVYTGVVHKGKVVRKIMQELHLSREETAYMGDDIPDIPAMHEVGLRLTVPSAPEALKEIAHWISPVPGGWGAVRCAIEFLFRLMGRDFNKEVLTRVLNS